MVTLFHISYPDVLMLYLLELNESLEDAILLDLYEVCGLDLAVISGMVWRNF